jgi:hypothetical protein
MQLNSFDLTKEFNLITADKLTETSAKRAVEIIRYVSEHLQDDEVAHALEDELYSTFIKQSQDPIAKLLLQTQELNFARWCA